MNMILTQLRFSAELEFSSVVRTVVDHGTPNAEVSVVYQSVENGADYGVVQFLRTDEAPGHLPGTEQSKHGAAAPVVARYLCRELSDSGAVHEIAPILMVVAFDVPADYGAEVEDWYNQEHIPMLTSADGWLRARRYEPVKQRGGPVYTSLALHELRDETVLDSPERKAARSTAWRARFVNEPWFQQAGRWVYRRIGSEGPYIG